MRHCDGACGRYGRLKIARKRTSMMRMLEEGRA